jgi:hypothetical protein
MSGGHFGGGHFGGHVPRWTHDAARSLALKALAPGLVGASPMRLTEAPSRAPTRPRTPTAPRPPGTARELASAEVFAVCEPVGAERERAAVAT